MFRHQQAVTTTAAVAQFHASNAAQMHSWYNPGYHPQGSQISTGPTPSYCMQEEQMWHHPAHSQPMFHPEYHDFVSMPQQPHVLEQGQLPSPPITVSGSDMSSPGGGGNVTPPQTQTRPTPVRSPFEWIKKTSYQTQPNPGKLIFDCVSEGSCVLVKIDVRCAIRLSVKVYYNVVTVVYYYPCRRMFYTIHGEEQGKCQSTMIS